MYIIDLGKLLPTFPEKFRHKKYLIPGCQSNTWIVLTINNSNTNTSEINLYGDSDAAIVKGIIVIIFSAYQNLNINAIINYNISSFLNTLKLDQNLTVTRARGVYFILNSIKKQALRLL